MLCEVVRCPSKAHVRAEQALPSCLRNALFIVGPVLTESSYRLFPLFFANRNDLVWFIWVSPVFSTAVVRNTRSLVMILEFDSLQYTQFANSAKYSERRCQRIYNRWVSQRGARDFTISFIQGKSSQVLLVGLAGKYDDDKSRSYFID